VRKFDSIKKSRKKSKDIDEKIEYLNKECQKTGLQEVMNTTGIYQGTNQVPNENLSDFKDLSQGGLGLGISGGNGNDAGGAVVGVVDDTVENCQAHIGLEGVAISPPHPVTGKRRCARTQTGFAGVFSPLTPGKVQTNSGVPSGGALWFYVPDFFNGAGVPLGRWFNFQWHPSQNSWAFWDTNFLGFFFLNANIDQYVLNGVNVGQQVNNKISGFNFGNNGDLGAPSNPVFFQNDLGDPSFLPINIPDLSGEAYEYLKNQSGDNLASTGYSDDTYNWYVKTYGAEAAGWYMNNPSSNPKNNPFLPGGAYTPFTDRADAGEPVSDTVMPGDFAGYQDGDEIAFNFGKGKPVDPNKKQNRSTTQNIINYINSNGSMGTLPKGWTKQQAQQFFNNYVNGTLSESLNEDVGIGHFDPEVLNVDINDIRKGIMPEFPKDPPPEMINGYSAKSRLVPKIIEGEPFIKITKKDLARNHKLTDKEINQYMDEINAINDYIKKNPAELIYAMTRYPKNDPRLAQLNFKMDEMKRASDRYIETHFPENKSLFNKLQDKIVKNIEQTNPKNFTGHKEAPKFTDELDKVKRRKKTVSKFFKERKRKTS